MIRHLFTGSRTKNELLISMARDLANEAIRKDEHIIVGDAWGVDAAVIQAANDAKYSNIVVHGWDNQVRNRTLYGQNVDHPFGPLERNRLMSRQCDKCTSIWDGVSKGTKAQMRYVREHGVKVVCYKYNYPMRTILPHEIE